MKTILIILGSLAALYIVYKTYSIASLDKGLGQKVRNGAVILDVRTQAEFGTGHLEGCTNISLGQLRTAHIPFNKKQVIIPAAHTG